MCWTLNNRSNQVEHIGSANPKYWAYKKIEKKRASDEGKKPDDNSTTCRKTRANPLKALSRKAYWEKQQLLLLYWYYIEHTKRRQHDKKKTLFLFLFYRSQVREGDNTLRPGRDFETITTGQGGGSGQDPSSIRWFGGTQVQQRAQPAAINWVPQSPNTFAHQQGKNKTQNKGQQIKQFFSSP